MGILNGLRPDAEPDPQFTEARNAVLDELRADGDEVAALLIRAFKLGEKDAAANRDVLRGEEIAACITGFGLGRPLHTALRAAYAAGAAHRKGTLVPACERAAARRGGDQ